MNSEPQILNQYEGFLKTPQLFITGSCLDAEVFYTDDPVDLRLSDDIIIELQRHKYLGKRAEFFLLQYLKSTERYSKITHSLQIQDDTTTIGEVDVICFDNLSQKWIHIELVYKLYVFFGEEDYDDFSQWIGSNLKDRLDYKIEKLKSHQLPMGQHSDILNKIKSNDIVSYCCFKAKLFLNSKQEQFKSQLFNNECISGHYLNFEEFKFLKHDDSLFYIPEKAEWLCDAIDNKKWYRYEKAEGILKPSIKDKRARLIWRKTSKDEYFEDFVVWW